MMLTAFRTRVAAAPLLAAATLLASCGPSNDESVALLPNPAGTDSGEPHLAQGPDGTVALSWLEAQGDATALRYSVLQIGQWQPAHTVARGSDWFVNWADFPSVMPFANGLWAAHWLVKRPGGTYAYDVAVAVSRDGGATWSKPVTPHDDGTMTEHGFVSLYETQGGIGALWLDGRNMRADGHDHGAAEANVAADASNTAGGMTLRGARITPDMTLSDPQLIDDLVCDCCQTDVAHSSHGAIAVYRNRTAEEVRDVYAARNVDGRWEPGRAVANDGWVIAGCPVNGPAIDAAGEQVVVAWFSAANDEPRVRMARSGDAAASFGSPIDVHRQRPLGRVDVVLLDNGDAAISWLQSANDDNSEAELVVSRVAVNGTTGPIQVLARTSAKRPSGFPQMLYAGGHLLFAWTDTAGETSRVMTARINAASLLASPR